ncbi:MAG: hypothetical protein ACRDJ4_00065 [Actinomycetota bacterium]
MPSLVRIGAIAAVLGGAAWAIKSASIILGGGQPQYLLEIGPVLFGVGLLGLHARLPRDDSITRVGGVLAYLSGSLAAIALVISASAGDRVTPATFSTTILGAFVTGLAALGVLGFAARRNQLLPAQLRWLPLAMGIAGIPMMLLGSVLSAIGEVLVEFPLLVLGVAWIFLGLAVWAETPGPEQTAEVAESGERVAL